MSLEDKVMRFKELVKRGYSVNKGLKEVGLSKRQYLKRYDGIWGDPEMAQFKPKPPTAKRPLEQRRQAASSTTNPEELKSDFEKRWDEIEREKAAILRAAMKITGVREESANPGEKKDPIKEIEEVIERRERMKQLLEKMGLKIEDQYMRRDEVERLIEEEKRKIVEEKLEDKKIEAIKDIMNNAVSQVVGLFKPAVDRMFPTPKPPAQAQVVEAPKLEGVEEQEQQEGQSVSEQSTQTAS
jgi:hypothetical protein